MQLRARLSSPIASLDHCRLVIPVSIASTGRAPAPAAIPSPSNATDARATTAATTAAVVGVLWRRAYKGKVDVDGLVEQLGVVGAVDGGAGFLEGGVFDESVALTRVNA